MKLFFCPIFMILATGFLFAGDRARSVERYKTEISQSAVVVIPVDPFHLGSGFNQRYKVNSLIGPQYPQGVDTSVYVVKKTLGLVYRLFNIFSASVGFFTNDLSRNSVTSAAANKAFYLTDGIKLLFNKVQFDLLAADSHLFSSDPWKQPMFKFFAGY